MGSYNCGYGHLRNARRFAEEIDLDPSIWEDNTEKMLLALSLPRNYNKPFIKYGYVRGREPVKYISRIFERYEHYMRFISL